MSQQFAIKDPRNGKPLTVSRDVYHALQWAEEKGKKQQTDLKGEIETISNALKEKKYLGETQNIKMVVQFDEKGCINEFGNLQIELNEKFNEPKVQQAIQEIMLTINQALSQRDSDMKTKLYQAQEKLENKQKQIA